MIGRQLNPSLFNLYSRDRFIRINLLLGFLINISLWLLLTWQARSSAELIPLHYNIYFGIDLLGPWYQIFLLPILGLIFLLINFLFGMAVYRRELILSYFLAGTSSFVQIIFVLAATFITLINF